MVIMAAIVGVILTLTGVIALMASLAILLDDGPDWMGGAATAVSIVLIIAGVMSASWAYEEGSRRDCASAGEQYMAKTKVINDECRYRDEKSGRWLDEDTWLYVTGLDN